MGVFGTGVMANDDAMDLLDRLAEASGPQVLLTGKLDRLEHVQITDPYLEIVYREGIAAIAVVSDFLHGQYEYTNYPFRCSCSSAECAVEADGFDITSLPESAVRSLQERALDAGLRAWRLLKSGNLSAWDTEQHRIAHERAVDHLLTCLGITFDEDDEPRIVYPLKNFRKECR